MTDINIPKIIDSCDLLQHRTCYVKGCMHSSVRCFDSLMRAFTGKPAAEAVTFKIFLNAPIMGYGEATIHRDGSMEMRTV